MTIFNYTVNYVDLAIVGVILISLFLGAKRGFMATIVGVFRYIIGFSLCIFASDRLSQPVYEMYYKERLTNAINDKVVTSQNIDEILDNLNAFTQNIPDFLKNAFSIDGLSVPQGGDVSTALVNMLEPITILAIKIVLFIAVFILFFLITGIILLAIKRAKKRRISKHGKSAFGKLLSFINHLLGGTFGAIKGGIFLLLIVSVLTYIICNVPNVSGSFINEVNQSTLFNMLQSYNPFNLITEGIV